MAENLERLRINRQLAINDQMIYNLLIITPRGCAMKWILLIGVTLLSTGCGVYRSTEIVEYRQVVVAPVVETVMFDYDQPGPLDVTTTTIDFY